MIRIGPHTGEILTLDGDVLGNGVNTAARIEPLAEPGGICISSDTYEQVRLRLDIETVILGRRDLKNIADAPEILRVRPPAPALTTAELTASRRPGARVSCGRR